MKTLQHIILASIFVAIQGYPPALAQDSNKDVINLNELRSVRNDLVRADLTTVADKKDKDVYFRAATITDQGTYDVVIKDKNDRLRMKGHYADADLKVAEGTFTYYYPNGLIESTGAYVNGVKTGTWERFHVDGAPKAEKNYSGMTWENMAVELGVASIAETH